MRIICPIYAPSYNRMVIYKKLYKSEDVNVYNDEFENVFSTGRNGISTGNDNRLLERIGSSDDSSNTNLSITHTLKNNFILNGGEYPPGSDIRIVIKGYLNYTWNIKQGFIRILLKNYLDQFIDDINLIDFDFINMMYSTKSNKAEINLSISEDDEGWPIVDINITKDSVVHFNLPYVLSIPTKTLPCLEYMYDNNLGVLMGCSLVPKNPSYIGFDINKLVSNSSYYTIDIETNVIYVGISFYDQIIYKSHGAYVVSDYMTNTLKIFDLNFKMKASIPAAGYTITYDDDKTIYYPKNLDPYKLGPVCCIDDIIYYIVRKEGNNDELIQELWSIDLYQPIPFVVHRFEEDTLPLIIDFTYDGENFIFAASDQAYYYNIHQDTYLYDNGKSNITFRENYDNIQIIKN